MSATLMLIDGKMCQWLPRLARFRSLPAMSVIADEPIPVCTFRFRRNAEQFSKMSSEVMSNHFGMRVPYKEIEIRRS